MEKRMSNCEEQQAVEQEALEELYEKIAAMGGGVREAKMPKGYLAAVADIEEFRQALGLDPGDETTKVTSDMIYSLPAFLMFAYPGTGATRAEAVENGIKGWQESKETAKTGRLLHGTFTIAGGQMSAYMPATSQDERRWTIEYVKDNAVAFVEYVDMDYEPIFGPDAEDVDRLNRRIEEIIVERGFEQ